MISKLFNGYAPIVKKIAGAVITIIMTAIIFVSGYVWDAAVGADKAVGLLQKDVEANNVANKELRADVDACVSEMKLDIKDVKDDVNKLKVRQERTNTMIEMLLIQQNLEPPPKQPEEDYGMDN